MPREVPIALMQRPCGDLFAIWSVENEDGTWELHFRVVCDDCERFARELAANLYAGKTLRGSPQ